MHMQQDEMDAAEEWALRLTAQASATRPPFSFTYGDKPAGKLLPDWRFDSQTAAAGAAHTQHVLTYTDLATGLQVRLEANQHHDFPAVEWILHLRNTGTADTPMIEELLPLDAALPLAAAANCVVRSSKGALCSAEDFELVERRLLPRGELRQRPGSGRSSSEVLPFWNVMLDGRGFILAVGWTGEWATRLARSTEGALELQAGMAQTHFRLRPGEEVRTPRLLMLFWADEPMRGHNLLRRFILAHHRPHPEGEPLLAPLCNRNWGGTPAEVHLDNIRQIVEQDLPIEYYGIDAEWFGSAGHWMKNAGHWEPRGDLYPQGLQPISEALHCAGRKLLLCFEPERVAPGTPWFEQLQQWLLRLPPEKAITWADYGDQLPPQEWLKMESARNQLNVGDRLLNLGDPEARRFLTDFLSDQITEFGIDCLRWDSNIAPLAYWRQADTPDRQGLTEIRYVEGLYAIWDELLARHPTLIIDNGASGGRRIDLESSGRTTPLRRSDYAAGRRDATAAQCHSFSLMHWLPLHGTSSGDLKDGDTYTLRSTMCSALAVGLWGNDDARQDPIPPDYPFDRAHRLLRQYLTVRRFFYGDFYPLTEYTRTQDAWMAYELYLPASQEGLLVVLKRPRSPFLHAALKLHGLDPDGEYTFSDWGGEILGTASGRVAMEGGMEVELPEHPDSALILFSAVG
jgi:alpha-galactosidase